MSPNERKDSPDLSELPDLAELDLNDQSNGSDLDLPELPDLPDLEVMTEATPSGGLNKSDELPELPELPDMPDAPKLAELPDLPELVDLPPVSKPARRASKPTASAAPTSKKRPAKPPVKPPQKIKPPQKVVKKASKPVEVAPKLEIPEPVVEPEPIVEPTVETEPVAQAAASVPEPVQSEANAKDGASDDSSSTESNGIETKVAAVEPIAAAAGGAPTNGAADPNRAPDTAPLQLRKAAWIVVVGSLFPWMGAEAGLIGAGAAKVVVCLGAWILYQCVLHSAGQKASGIIVKLASIRFGTPSDKRNKSFPEKLAGILPSLGHLVGLVVLLAGVFITVQDPNFAGGKGDVIKGLAEVGMLAWATSTLVHIRAFIHGGKFNPIFPLMFIGMVFAGLISLISSFGVEDTAMMASGVLGSLCVTAGGFYACYTIFEAMKQAKSEGEAKKAAQREARKAARGDSGGGKAGAKGGKRSGAVVRKRR